MKHKKPHLIMHKVYIITFVLVACVLYQFNVYSAQNNKNFHFIIASTGDKKLDNTLTKYRKEFEAIIKDTSSIDQRSVIAIKGKTFFLNLLHSFGYYAACVNVDNSELPAESNAPLVFKITSGAQYTIGDIKIRVLESSSTHQNDLTLPDPSVLKFRKGDAAVAKVILEEESTLYAFIELHNCLMNIDVSHQAIVDNINASVDITYNIKVGEIAYINNINFEGLKDLNEEYARKLIPIKKNDCFKRTMINKSRVALQNSGLFSIVHPMVPSSTNAYGKIDIKFKVQERLKRTIKTGIQYTTDLGVGGVVSWECRNAFTKGEKINTAITIDKIEKKFDVQFEKPFFIVDNQKLKILSTIEQNTNKAFISDNASLSVSLERAVKQNLIIGSGVKYDLGLIKEEQSKNRFALFSVPSFITYDNRDNILDPRRGVLLKGEISPFNSVSDSKATFLKTTIFGSYYIPLNTYFDPVIAVRAKCGSISGLSSTLIPAIIRFYAGGGGSIRGYGYQLVGPLSDQNRPLGGRSLIETTVELRSRINKTIGINIFLDSGNVFQANYPTLKDKLYKGIGLGLEYYTTLGPIKIDIATPIKRRKFDSAFCIYFSIGQSF